MHIVCETQIIDQYYLAYLPHYLMFKDDIDVLKIFHQEDRVDQKYFGVDFLMALQWSFQLQSYLSFCMFLTTKIFICQYTQVGTSISLSIITSTLDQITIKHPSIYTLHA